jgi:diadenosine tetraphosphatase ApaH/serine/threonine PP2A family protein phosphatase
MKIAFLSCIHSNLPALEAVERDLSAAGAQKVYCAGDIVGYGAQPRECVNFVRERGWPTVIGNHEQAMFNTEYSDQFMPAARAALFFSMGTLGRAERDWVQTLPESVVEQDFQLVHGFPSKQDTCRRYVLTVEEAQAAFAEAARPWVFLGHTHVPLSFFKTAPISYSKDAEWKLDKKLPALLNVGSVGQPRDKDPRAGYALFDTDTQTVSIRRVKYDNEKAAALIREAGLPDRLGQRLLTGV